LIFSWIGYDSWTYKKNFILPAGFSGPNRLILLECDGLDTVAQIFVNGKRVGSANNMFRQYQFDVTSVVARANASNSLVIQFQSAASYAKAQAEAYPYELPTADSAAQHGAPFRNMIRKEQSSFSWDWGPMFLTQGVWRGIRIVSYSTVRMESTAVSITKSQKAGSNRWTVTVQADVSAFSKSDVSFTVR
jgi:beta-mannosidase